VINRRLLSLAVLVLLALSVIGAPQSASALITNTPAKVDFSCTAITVLESGSFTFDRNNTGIGGESYTLTITDGDGTVLYSESGAGPVGTSTQLGIPGFSVPYQSTPNYNPISINYDSPAGNGFDAQHIVFASGACDGLPYYSSAGCDQFVDIPPQAVGGAFVANAPVYFAPQSDTPTGVMIEAGKTYLVAGQDATGQFRKVLISCTWVWVPADTVGPNYESPWNGAPLPTTVVN
jgi:hypothetical protein